MEKELLDGDAVFVIHDFLSREECDRFIARSEDLGYELAPITTSGGFVKRTDIRNNGRVMVDDLALAEELWPRLQPFLPPVLNAWEVAGLNERFRFYRYDIDEKFAPHYDGHFDRGNQERSKFTFMVYLNEGFQGGATNFYYPDGRIRLSIQPRCGKALLFLHDQLHEGAPVLAGRKYVLRSDVMYRPRRA